MHPGRRVGASGRVGTVSSSGGQDPPLSRAKTNSNSETPFGCCASRYPTLLLGSVVFFIESR